MTELVGREEELQLLRVGGQRRRLAKAKWSFYPAKPVSANRGLLQRLWNA